MRAMPTATTKHTPALPLYTQVDAERALTLLQPVGFNRPVPVAEGIDVEFINAGIFGSAYAVSRWRVRRCFSVATSGATTDLCCRIPSPIRTRRRPSRRIDLRQPDSRRRRRSHTPRGIVNDTLLRGGKLIIPAFAVGRVEEVLYWLRQLEAEKRVPGAPCMLTARWPGRRSSSTTDRTEELDPTFTTMPRAVSVCLPPNV